MTPTRHSLALWNSARENIMNARPRHAAVSDFVSMAEHVTAAANAYGAALDQLEALKPDQRMSDAAKREKADAIAAAAQETATGRLERLKAQREKAVRYYEARTEYPASDGTPADREARLANARADVHRLLANVPAGQRAERLRFAVENGSQATRELLLREKYAERVLWPSAGPDAAVDAEVWSRLRRDLIASALGEPARQAYETLDALNGPVRNAEAFTEHAAHMDAGNITAAVQAFGPPPTAPAAPAAA